MIILTKIQTDAIYMFDKSYGVNAKAINHRIAATQSRIGNTPTIYFSHLTIQGRLFFYVSLFLPYFSSFYYTFIDDNPVLTLDSSLLTK